MKALRRMIPSMFQRRLTLLMLVFMVSLVVLWGQLFRLTVVQGASLLEEAEMKMVDVELLPTRRGDILDRKGRLLATDRPTYDIRADYELISGEWASKQAYKHARKDHAEDWSKLKEWQRDALRDELLPIYTDRLEELWDELCQIGGIEREELDERRAEVIQEVHELRAHLWGVWFEMRKAQVDRPVPLSEVAQDIREMRVPHVLIIGVDDKVAYRARQASKKLQFNGVSVERSKLREYPNRHVIVQLPRDTLPSLLADDTPFATTVADVGMNLIGEMRDVWHEDVARRPYRVSATQRDLGGYLPGDIVGANGVESSMEDTLRGNRGEVLTHQDTNEEERTLAVEGRDVQLSIDLHLQARVRAILDPDFGLMRSQKWYGNDDIPEGTKLYGAAVVLDVESGELLAMVSTPVGNRNDPDIMLDPNRPMENKAIAAVYPPGSTLKPIIYAIAASKGALENHNSHFQCDGYLDPNNRTHLRCWIYRPGFERGHGLLNPVEAIAKSCNIYFFRCGRAIGGPRMIESLHEWGFDQEVDIGVPGAVTGILPSLTEANPPGREVSLPNATQIGIGQGPIAVPPLQVAAAHAALARGGMYISPTIIHNDARERVSRDLHLSRGVRNNIFNGMYNSANSIDGTAHHLPIGNREPIINYPGVRVQAKTGTAQATPQYPLKQITTEDGRELIVADKSKRPLRQGNHGWYVLHVTKEGQNNASYIITVLTEFGGSGGKSAGPVANQILYALGAEGYL